MKRAVSFIFLILFAFSIFTEDINISGYKLRQFNALFNFVFPDTILHEGDFIVIGRDCSKDSFETFWNTAFGDNVLYFNSNDAIPKINGDEIFALFDSTGMLIDSTYASQPSDGGVSMQRDSSNVNTWNSYPSSSANPASFSGGNHGSGLLITEFADTLGTGNFIFEFVEIYNDSSSESGIDETESRLFNFEFAYKSRDSEITLYFEVPLNGFLNINLFDALGRTLLHDNVYLSGAEINIHIGGLKSGIYFIDCNYNNLSETQKILVF